MVKRKKPGNKPSFWMKDELYVVPYEYISFKLLREEFPDIRVIFIKNCTPMSICKELTIDRKWENKTSNYYIVDEEINYPIKTFKLMIGRRQVIWDGTHFIHRQTIICEKCFVIGILTPKNGCLVHTLKCNHKGRKLKSESCEYCLARSFASSWVEVLKSIKTTDNLLYVFKHCTKSYDFHCIVCNHDFPSVLHCIDDDRFCPYCAYPSKKLCGVKECNFCFVKSLASWDDVKKLACLKKHHNPLLIFKQCNTKHDFQCDVCFHDFSSSLANVVGKKKNWCPYCSGNKLCGKLDCQFCFAKSFASYDKDKVSCLINADPLLIFKSSNCEYDFFCNTCYHKFPAIIWNITGKNNWCSYCSNHRLCGDEHCVTCFNKSFASVDSKILSCLRTTLNSLLIFKHSNDYFDFECIDCGHYFESQLNNIMSGCWCPYCSGNKLCGKITCQFCFVKTFASFDQEKVSCLQTKLSPLLLFKGSSTKHDFLCKKCTHIFPKSLHDVTYFLSWCPYCIHRKCCGKEDCLTCFRKCEMAKCWKKSRKQTRMTKRWYCSEDFEDCILRDPNETPLMYRAQVSIEIYTLAELQRTAFDNLDDHCNYYWSNPTSWDCRMIPGLAYKPDNLFCFDKNMDLLPFADNETLNLNNLGYVMMTEVLEEGKQQHSDARGVSDSDRESDIRTLFDVYKVPIGVLYISMAHTKHFTAHPDDVFFHKIANGEYEVITNRVEAFQVRMKEVLDTLTFMFENKLNSTKWIGH
jgi:hypothetical protein